jgi:hypothetical protein
VLVAMLNSQVAKASLVLEAQSKSLVVTVLWRDMVVQYW